ncbi:hypothetical protein [uncultured Paludibaculum sp.]|uniref:hypothetical protein n=1 Tax=uncultured Paludibaculum sp. TaxID=1765020 RepID=UPI002AAC2535|nr:hypothetical protein [uncultured Paludibaculum sp.]
MTPKCTHWSAALPAVLLFSLTPALLSAAKPPASGGRVFILTNSSRDLAEFRAFAQAASALKPYGRVQIDIGVLAEKSWHELPPGRSPWHEYASFMPAPDKFFPHPKIAPFLPADWVARNRQLLLGKAAILRELGLEAAFSSKDSHFLPEAFFEKYPHLRGPRVDHPRRSAKEEFAWCVDLPETREMIEWMYAELKRNVPEIQTILTGTNDAGAGLCWGAALYSGPNGPQHCRRRGAGERVHDLTASIHRGALQGGGDVDVRFRSANFWQNEEDVVLPLLPPRTFINERDPALMSTGSLLNDVYPVLGLMNPLDVIGAAEKLDGAKGKTAYVALTSMYARANEEPRTVAKLIEVLQYGLEHPAHSLTARLDNLRDLSARWGGEKNRDVVFEAFLRLDQAFRLKHAAAPKYNNFYCGVSMRQISRPLLWRPETLSSADERYFLPFVFNIYEAEARTDYIDLAGIRYSGPASWSDPGLNGALDEALAAARLLDTVKDAPESEWLHRLSLSLGLWVSEVRSIHNFYFAQLLRDRNQNEPGNGQRSPAKIATWTGAPGYLEWFDLERAEFDNTVEMVRLLEDGGLPLFSRAKTARDQDTFVMGPDIVGDLKHKASIMRGHWLDAQRDLPAPLK